MSILEIENLNVTYKSQSGDSDVLAIKDFTLTIELGESIGIVGESGSGKSTLAMSILRLHNHRKTIETGKIKFQSQDLLQIKKSEMNKIRWKELAAVFQKSMNALSPIHRIGMQLEDVYRVHEPKKPARQIKEHILNLFTLVNLPDRVYSLYPHELSGGMLQRVSIALSLLHNPSLLIMDEATTALDVVTQGQILSEVQKIEQEKNMTRIMITHDISVVATACKKILVLYAGEIMEVGLVRDVLTNPSHPYTQGLLNSFPSLRGEKKELVGIPGFLPDLTKRAQGCIFSPRCPHAEDICREKKPSNYKVTDEHFSYCHMLGSEY